MKIKLEAYKVFKSDVEAMQIKKAYEKLKGTLSLKINRMDDEALIEALDASAENYFIGSQLHLTAINEREKFRIYYNNVMSGLHAEAQEELEKLKKEKKITSQITAELRAGWIQKNRSELHDKLQNIQRKVRIMRDNMEALKEALKSRMSILQSQARIIEQKKVLLLGKKGG